MSGPVPGIPAVLQPVAHALLQMQREIHYDLSKLGEEYLWARPKNMASVGFHLKHITGVIDRMFSYAEEKSLTAEQLDYLAAETQAEPHIQLSDLITALDTGIATALSRLKDTDERRLTETRFLGRKKIPVTLIGLLFHSAEHGMRHLGQLKVTAKIVA